MAVGGVQPVWAGCSACPAAAVASASAAPQKGLALAALICFAAPLALLLVGAWLAGALLPAHPEWALLGLLSLPGVALGARRRVEFSLARDAAFAAQEPRTLLIGQT